MVLRTLENVLQPSRKGFWFRFLSRNRSSMSETGALNVEMSCDSQLIVLSVFVFTSPERPAGTATQLISDIATRLNYDKKDKHIITFVDVSVPLLTLILFLQI